jgi:hypothetical protein
MTTLAFDGRYFAADSMMTGFQKSHLCCKLYVHRTGSKVTVIGGCGSAAAIPIAVAWYLRGLDYTAFPGDCKLLVVKHTIGKSSPPRVFVVEYNGRDIEAPIPASEGSGGLIALGAMLAKANAIESTKISGQIDYAVNETIHAYDILEGKWIHSPAPGSEESLHDAVAKYLPVRRKRIAKATKSSSRKKKP